MRSLPIDFSCARRIEFQGYGCEFVIRKRYRQICAWVNFKSPYSHTCQMDISSVHSIGPFRASFVPLRPRPNPCSSKLTLPIALRGLNQKLAAMAQNLKTSDNPSIAVSSNSPADIATEIANQNPAPKSSFPPNRQAVSISSAFGGAKDFTVKNSIINTIGGNFNQSVLKFDGSECTC